MRRPNQYLLTSGGKLPDWLKQLSHSIPVNGMTAKVPNFYFGLIEGFELKTCDVKVKKKRIIIKNFRRNKVAR